MRVVTPFLGPARAMRLAAALLTALLGTTPASAGVTSAGAAQDSAAAVTSPTVHARQTGEADVVGADDVALATALERLRASGGTLVIGPGRWVVRRTLFLPKDVVVRGEPGALLALPRPALTTAAVAAGARELVLAGAHEFAADTRVQILPPVGNELFPDGSKPLELQTIARVEGQTLVLAEPLPLALPAASRIGYAHKLLWIHKEGRARVEDLAFEGGRDPAIPMPGHSQRCAIWASAPFGFGEQRLGPPGVGVVVRRARFSDWYGRALAFYHHVDGVVEDCRFERIDDEAIDLDHFVERFLVARNELSDVRWGIVLNDASRNRVEENRIDACEIGIWSWQYELTPRQGINEENVIRANHVTRARDKAILIDASCVRYVVQDNVVDAPIVVVESENTVGPNVERATQAEPQK
jgi:hypothetical protein